MVVHVARHKSDVHLGQLKFALTGGDQRKVQAGPGNGASNPASVRHEGGNNLLLSTITHPAKHTVHASSV